MKSAEIYVFILIVALCASCDGKRRDKRTLGSILNFFGFQIVPLNAGLRKLPENEKYEFPAQNQRNPKFNRIQTIMPFEISEATSPPTETTSATTAQMTSSEAPMIESSSFMNTAPLRIIMFDPSSEMTPSALPEAASESLKLVSTTEAVPFEVSSEMPAPASPSLEPLTNEELPSPATTSSTDQSMPMEKVPADEDIDTRFNQDSGNFEQFRSNDVTNSFFARQSMQPTFGLYPQYLMPPRPFAQSQQQIQHDPNSFSSSSATMNMNGQYFNYLTYHR